MTRGVGEGRAQRVGVIASNCLALAMLAIPGCAVAPSDDCAAKATCPPLLYGGPADGANATSDFNDASLESGTAARQPAASGGGAIDARNERADNGDAAMDAPTTIEIEDDGGGAVVACRPGYQCAPPVPSLWFGPITFWQADSDAPAPGCPPGYFWPRDVRQGLNAPPAVCASTCGAVGQQCAASVSVFNDSNCVSPCASGSVSSACAAVTGCLGHQGTLWADPPVPSGGTCVPSVRPTVAPATWSIIARMCVPALPSLASCANSNGLCVPTPAPPYPSRPCIVQVSDNSTNIPVSCPSAYPNGPSVYYQSFADNRACSTASCTGAGPTGGSCAGTVALSGTPTGPCTTGAFAYAIGSGCSLPFILPGPVSQISASYTLTPGSCSVGTDAQPTGLARPSGPAHVVCCM